jgi:DNA-binding response OmpR family regulator
MGPVKVLVVDDEPAICEMLREFLEANAYQVVVATSGDDALETYTLERPDLVLLDFWMPEKNGLETLRELKGLDPKVNVIMVTAALDRKLYRLVMAEGAFDYLTKPINLNHLLLALRTRLALLGCIG